MYIIIVGRDVSRVRKLVVLVVVLGSLSSLGVGVFLGIVQPPTHYLDGVAVTSAADEAATVDVQVYADGGSQLVVDRTVTVPPRTVSLEPDTDGDGVQTGFSMAGQTTVSGGRNDPGTFVVRARLDGRENWSTVDLGRLDRVSDPPWWRSWIGDRYLLDDRECFGVRVWVDEGPDTGVRMSDRGCNSIPG